jgi:DNA repair protein RadC
MRLQLGHGPIEEILPNLAQIVSGLEGQGEVIFQIPLNKHGEVIDEIECLASPTQPKNLLPLELVLQYPKDIGAAEVTFVSNSCGELTSPAEADIDFTRRLIDAGRTVGVPIADHYLAANDHYISLRQSTDLWS